MSQPVGLEDLAITVADLAPSAYLCSVSADGRPKVAHVPVTAAGDNLMAEVGPGTVRNIEERPAVTLVWPGQDQQSMSLLVDAAASATDNESVIVLSPTGAVWHRPAPPPDIIGD